MATIQQVDINSFDGNTPLSAHVTFSDDSVADIDFISTSEPTGPPTAAIEDHETSERIVSIVFVYPE